MSKRRVWVVFLSVLMVGLVFPLMQFGQGLAKKGWPKFQGPSKLNNGRSDYAGTAAPGLKWKAEFGENFKNKSLSIGPDGVIYVASLNKLYAIVDKGDGYEKVWNDGINISKPSHVTVSNDGYLFVGTGNCINDKMYKIKASDGSIEWEYDLSQYSACAAYPATIADDGTIIFGIGGYGTRYLIALNQDKTLKWEIPFGDNVETLPTISKDGKFVYAGNNLNDLYKVEIETGNIEYAPTNPPNGKYMYGHIAVSDNGERLYFTSATYGPPYIYSYSSDLSYKWKKYLGAEHYTVPPSLDKYNTIYTGALSQNKLFALKDNGDECVEKWSEPFELDSDFIQPPVIDANNIVYVVTRNYLYAIKSEGNSGSLEWKFPWNGTTLNGQGHAQPAIAEDGTIYLLTKNGTLYAIGETKIKATIDIDPNTLDKKSRGKWVTCYIELPEGNDVNDIDISTIELEYDSQTLTVKKSDIQGNILMVKFSRQDLKDILGSVVGYVELKVTGKVVDKTFEGTDTIRFK